MHFISRKLFQEYLLSHYNTYKTEVDFITAYHYFKKNNLILDKIPSEKSFSSFQELSDKDFFDYLDDVYIAFDHVINPDDIFQVNEISIIPDTKDIFVLQHLQHLKSFMHNHDYFELNYVFKGSCIFTFRGDKRTLNEGNLLILSPQSSHNIFIEKETHVVTICIRKSTFYTTFFSLLSGNDMLALFFRSAFQKNSKENYLLIHGEEDTGIKQIIKNLSLENTRFDQYSNSSCISWINLLFNTLLRNNKDTLELFDYKMTTDFSLVLKYIQDNYQHTTLSKLSSRFNYSIPYLSLLIKKSTGQNYSDLIKNLRLSDASDYLVNTTLKITEIAELCGYHSSDHFSRTFRSFYNLSPRQYRKTYSHL